MLRLTILLSFVPLAWTTAQTPPAAAFEQVGVIEGFYGPAWSHQDRLAILRFMGRVGLTHYYYAPKEDPYHLARWREAYPDSAFRALGELASVAREQGVTFVFAISPGGSMVYSDSADYARLLAKLDRIMTLGIRDMALLLDDVLPTLQHASDRSRFHTLAEAHAALVVALRSDLARRGARLTAVAPTTYTDAWGDREYLRELGRLIPGDVPLFWTGVDVVSPDITVAQASEWTRLTGHRPLVWDNYPVNDFARWRLFLGPLRNRTADLPDGVRGIIANPMNEAHASMLALATLATYAADPARYDPDAALAAALDTLYGNAAEFVRPFLSAYGDYADDDNVFEPLFLPANRFAAAPMQSRLAELRVALHSLDSAAGTRPHLRSLHTDLAPFVTRTARRLDDLESSSAWTRDGDDLVYRVERDRVAVATLRRPIAVDGEPSDWAPNAWHPVGDGVVAQYAVGARAESLYIAVRVEGAAPRAEAADRIGVGDHIAILVQADDADRRILTPEDLLMLASPDDVRQVHVPFSDFMAKYLGDNEHFRWSEFFLSTFARPADDTGWHIRTARQASGWTAEFAGPLPNDRTLRISLTATAQTTGGRRTDALSARNFPGNPATFAELAVEP